MAKNRLENGTDLGCGSHTENMTVRHYSTYPQETPKDNTLL